MFIERGGGIINRKLLLSVILLLGLILVLNFNTLLAANLTGNAAPKLTAVNPADQSIILKSQSIKVYFAEPIKAGSMSIILKNSAGKVIKTRNSISGKTITIFPLAALPTAVKYYITFNTGSVKSLSGIDNSKYSSSFTVSPLTLAQMKNGISRAEKFYNTNQRLPKYVNYGSKKIPIATFQKIIATQGLKIKTNTLTPILDSKRPVYITSDNIVSKTKDNARINNIITRLKALGIKAYNMGVGPNNHIKVLQSSRVPKNALIVNIYGGACAGTIWEMGGSWYKTIKGSRGVFSVFLPPATDITNLAFLPRSYDDNFSPKSFKGLAYPDIYLKSHGYSYIYSESIVEIVKAILPQAKN